MSAAVPASPVAPKAALSAPPTPQRKKDWADEDDSDSGDELREQFGMRKTDSGAGVGDESALDGEDTGAGKSPEQPADDRPVASLLSRIGGLATSDTDAASSSTEPAHPPASSTSPASTSRERPKANIANNLFGRALASATSSRRQPSPSPTPAAAAEPSAPAPEHSEEGNSASLSPPEQSQAGNTSAQKPTDAMTDNEVSPAQEAPKELMPAEDKESTKAAAANGDETSTPAPQDDGWETTAPAKASAAEDDGWETSAPAAQGSAEETNASAAQDDGWETNATPAPAAEGDGWGESAAPAEEDKAGNGGEAARGDDGWEANAEGNGNGGIEDAGGLIANEFEVELVLADMQADPNSPLYSVKEFEALPIHPDLLKGIYAAGFKKPSKIQERALPMLLNNPPRNLIGQSQSGTGKTAAFALNVLSRVDPGLPAPQAIVLAPSRELARQILEVIDSLGQFTPIKTMLAVPGSWSRHQRIEHQILVGTPGTLVDMLSRGGRIFDPQQIRVFVLDEADEMVALQGLGDQTVRIKKMLPPHVQNVLFSATFSDEVRYFAENFAPEANQMFLAKEDITVDAIKQLYLECDGEEQKYNALAALYDCMSIGQSIVFCRRRETADRIAYRLSEEGHAVASLHGEKMTQERDSILDGFRNGKTKVLITTNVIARGIDILQVNMVVNYDVPDMGPEGGFRPDIETYIHRIGRTGRFGRKGCSVIFVHDQRSQDDVQEIIQTLGKPMKRIDASSKTDLDDLEKALKLAMKGVEKST